MKKLPVFTLGVEEEYQIIDPVTRDLRSHLSKIVDGAKIGNDCIIGAGSLVTKNTVIPDGSLVLGSPAKIKRNLTWEEKLGIVENSKEYLAVSEEMKAQDVL